MDLYPLSAEVGQEIRAEMARQRVGIGQIADALGVYRHTARRKLNGQSPLNLNDLEHIAKRLHVTASDLVARAKRDAA